MPKATGKPGFYAVAKGRKPGIYTTWDDASAQVNGFAGAKYKKHTNAADAEDWIRTSGGPPEFFNAFASETSAAEPRPTPYTRLQAQDGPGPSSAASRSKRATEKLATHDGWDVVYCDGACKGNGQPGSIAGVGVWWADNDSRNIAERCPGGQTNNRAELIAIVRVLETASLSKRPLMIKTDSKYCIQCVRDWMPGWQRNGWKTASGQPVKNKPVVQYIAALINARGLRGQKVHFEHVAGHSGILGNERADAQANMGALCPEEPERDWDAIRAEVEEGHWEPETPTVSGTAKAVAQTSAPVASSSRPPAPPVVPSSRPPAPPVRPPPVVSAPKRSSAAPASSSPVPLVVYTDGACKGNGQPGSIAGVGVWWGRNDPRNIAERCPGGQTNQRAEIIAAIRALETAPHSMQKLVIKTDSMYTINCVTKWMVTWERNGWRTSTGKPAKNVEVLRYLSALWKSRTQRGQEVEFVHVRGHVGIEGNEGADGQANMGALLPELPERDWDALRAQIGRENEEDEEAELERLRREMDPTGVVGREHGKGKVLTDDDWALYADGLADDEELLAELDM